MSLFGTMFTAGPREGLRDTFGLAATYTPPGTGASATAFTAILQEEDASREHMDGREYRVRRGNITGGFDEVAAPVERGLIVVDGDTWEIARFRDRDADAGMWTAECETLTALGGKAEEWQRQA